MPPPRLALVDILHRTFIVGCVGVTLYGGYLAFSVHENTMQKSKGGYSKLREAEMQQTGAGFEDQLAAAAQDAVAQRHRD
ncbi:hypothetical protein M408DRAFT_50983, partial [Serendipita vermifera MAFF 305830]